MPISSPLRHRRFRQTAHQPTQQIIAFRLHQDWFALPIEAVAHVMQLGQHYGDPQNQGISLMMFQDQELAVIDVSQRVFSIGATATAPAKESPENRCLVVVKNQAGQKVGLPIDSQPEIRRVLQEKIVQLPETYQERGDIRCISQMMIDVEDNQPPLFILDPEQLTQV